MKTKNKLIIYTDGGCEPNPGNGCWAFVCTNPYVEDFGVQINTTSNRMELTAIIKAIEFFKSLKTNKKLGLFSDSKYAVNGFNNWMHGWAVNSWVKSDFTEVKNVDLWKRLYALHEKNRIFINWVKGHNGNEYNEAADQLVRDAYMNHFDGEMQY